MKVFISYRREDSAGHAGRLHDSLQSHFGADNVFMDLNDIDIAVRLAGLDANSGWVPALGRVVTFHFD